MRVSGFEPESLSWQPRIITWLYYTRIIWALVAGVEPSVPMSIGGCRHSPLNTRIKLAEELGIEPRITESKSVVIPFNYSPTIWQWVRDSNSCAAFATFTFPRCANRPLWQPTICIQHPVARILFYANINLCHNPN